MLYICCKNKQKNSLAGLGLRIINKRRVKKSELESALKELKAAHESKNIAQIDSAMTKMNNLFSTISQNMYGQGGANPNEAGANPNHGAQQSNNDSANKGKDGKDSEVTDTDFEEVK